MRERSILHSLNFPSWLIQISGNMNNRILRIKTTKLIRLFLLNTITTKTISSVCFASHFVQITMLLSLEFYFDKWHSNCCLKCDGLSLLLEAKKKLQRVIQIHHTVVKLHFVSNQQNSFNVFDESSRWYYIRLLPV